MAKKSYLARRAHKRYTHPTKGASRMKKDAYKASRRLRKYDKQNIKRKYRYR